MLGYKENVVFYCSSWIQGDNNSIRSGDSKKIKIYYYICCGTLVRSVWPFSPQKHHIIFKKKWKNEKKKKNNNNNNNNNNSAGMVRHTKHEAEVQFKPSSNAFSRNTVCLNAESNLRFGSAAHLNLGLNFGPVLQSSGSNFGSGPNFGNTSRVQNTTIFSPSPLSTTIVKLQIWLRFVVVLPAKLFFLQSMQWMITIRRLLTFHFPISVNPSLASKSMGIYPLYKR